jgi:glutaredoxin
MFARKLKTRLLGLLILAAGSGAVYAAPARGAAPKPAYSTVDRVVLYGTATCPYCAQARAHLRAKNIPFADVDLDTSAKGRREFARLGGKGVPLILVGESRVIGFDQEALDAALAKTGQRASP